MNFFSAARKGVQSASTCSGLFFVVFRCSLFAFLKAALEGSSRSLRVAEGIEVVSLRDASCRRPSLIVKPGRCDSALSLNMRVCRSRPASYVSRHDFSERVLLHSVLYVLRPVEPVPSPPSPPSRSQRLVSCFSNVAMASSPRAASRCPHL